MPMSLEVVNIDEGIAYRTPAGEDYMPIHVFTRVRRERDALRGRLKAAERELERILERVRMGHD